MTNLQWLIPGVLAALIIIGILIRQWLRDRKETKALRRQIEQLKEKNTYLKIENDE